MKLTFLLAFVLTYLLLHTPSFCYAIAIKGVNNFQSSFENSRDTSKVSTKQKVDISRYEPYIQESLDKHVGELVEFISIPSVSSLPAHKPDVNRAAQWLKAKLQRIGMNRAKYSRRKATRLLTRPPMASGAFSIMRMRLLSSLTGFCCSELECLSQ
jgi:hypothetical protein